MHTNPNARSRDRSIQDFVDNILGLLGRQIRLLLLLAAIAAVFWAFLLPSSQRWLPMLGMGAMLLFQLFFAMMFMIVQFGALFWFLGRGPRLLGETRRDRGRLSRTTRATPRCWNRPDASSPC